MKLVKMTAENWKTEVKELYAENSDWSGENGLDYVKKEAIQAGFTSNLDFTVAEAIQNHPDDWEKALDEVHEEFKAQEGGYYKSVQIAKLEAEDGLYVSLALLG